MGRALILETTFLIDLEREHNRNAPGPAFEYLEGQEDARLYLTFTVAGELAAGTPLSAKARWESFLGPFYVLQSTPAVCWEYGKACRFLRDTGRLIGANDLWIASTALAYRMPVVTRNVEHYRRVPDLEVEVY